MGEKEKTKKRRRQSLFSLVHYFFSGSYIYTKEKSDLDKYTTSPSLLLSFFFLIGKKKTLASPSLTDGHGRIAIHRSGKIEFISFSFPLSYFTISLLVALFCCFPLFSKLMLILLWLPSSFAEFLVMIMGNIDS